MVCVGMCWYELLCIGLYWYVCNECYVMSCYVMLSYVMYACMHAGTTDGGIVGPVFISHIRV